MAIRNSARRLGLRHVNWVRVVIDGDLARAEVHGIGHRLPRALPVPMTTASALVSEGVPLVLQDGEVR